MEVFRCIHVGSVDLDGVGGFNGCDSGRFQGNAAAMRCVLRFDLEDMVSAYAQFCSLQKFIRAS